VADIVGVGSVVPFGVRSCSLGEKEDSGAMGLTYVTADLVRDLGAERALLNALDGIPRERRERIYLSVDIDCIDPAFAPGVGTPEPFGLDPLDVRSVIRALAPRLVGFDVVEVCPPADNGNTSALAARLISEVIAWVGRERF
jgi:arginase family enzyme